MKQGRTERDWVIVAVLTFIAGGVVTALIIGDGAVSTENRDIDWPAWVQAIGSVAGIFAAVGVPVWQRHLSDRDRFERERIERIERAMKFRRALETFLRNIKKNGPSTFALDPAHLQPVQIEDMVPGELKEILHQANLLPVVGGTVLTAVNFAEQAQDSRGPQHLGRGLAYERFRWNAERRCKMALEGIKKMLSELSDVES